MIGTLRNRARGAVLLSLLLAALPAAWAYPEFQAEIAKSSRRPINCALCHSHPDGPEGSAHGQIGSLNPVQVQRLQEARAAFAPGATVDNPLLNPFGNDLVKLLGKKQILELRLTPARLPAALPPTLDRDGDGISDAQELRDGTHPLLKSDGRPARLFRHNFQRYFGQILLTTLATLAGLYGIRHLLQGFALTHADEAAPDHGEDHPAPPPPA